MMRRIVLSIVLILLTGCNSDQLYSNLDEKEANEIISLLSSSGIDASKTKDGDGEYTVFTNHDAFSEAIQLLKTNGYPRNKFQSLGEVFKKEGFVSSPLEERARLNYAESQELARTIESIDGVVLARVHLAIPKESKLNSEEKPSSASVFIKHRRGIDLSGREAQIKALIVNSIEGLPYENVTVAMFSTNPLPVKNAFTKEYADTIFSLSVNNINYLVISLAILVILLTVFIIGIWLSKKKQINQLQIANTK
jgi:type III secretion protein J